jgi:hypothetical protein
VWNENHSNNRQAQGQGPDLADPLVPEHLHRSCQWEIQAGSKNLALGNEPLAQSLLKWAGVLHPQSRADLK